MSKNATPWVKRLQKEVKSNQESITDVTQWKYWLLFHGQHRTKKMRCKTLLVVPAQHPTHPPGNLVCTKESPSDLHNILTNTCQRVNVKTLRSCKKALKSKRSHISVWQRKVCRSMIRSWSAQKILLFEKYINMDWNTKSLECNGIWKHQSSKLFLSVKLTTY